MTLHLVIVKGRVLKAYRHRGWALSRVAALRSAGIPAHYERREAA